MPSNSDDVKNHRNFRDKSTNRMTAGSIGLGNAVPNCINLYAPFFTDVGFFIQFLSGMASSGGERAGASFERMWAGSSRPWCR